MTDRTITTTAPAETQVVEAADTTRESRRYLAPPVDIYEVPEGLAVVADMPGVGRDGIEVKVENGILTLVGRMAGEEPSTPMLHREFELRDYFRQFRLTDQVDVDNISAELKRGVLRVLLPRRRETLPRQIEVKVG